MIWLRLFWWMWLRGFLWGATLGALFGFIHMVTLWLLFGANFGVPLGLVFGALFGAIPGLMLGAVNGVLFGVISWMYFGANLNERSFTCAVQLVGVVVNIIGTAAIIMLIFGVTFLPVVPPLIAGVTAYFLSSGFVKYAGEQMHVAQLRLAANKSHLNPSG